MHAILMAAVSPTDIQVCNSQQLGCMRVALISAPEALIGSVQHDTTQRHATERNATHPKAVEHCSFRQLAFRVVQLHRTTPLFRREHAADLC